MVEVVNMRTCEPPWGRHGDIRIDRTTKWGNPFVLEGMNEHFARYDAIEKYKTWLLQQMADGKLDIKEIGSAKRLGCWCKPKACHGDHLKKLINDIKDGKQQELL